MAPAFIRTRLMPLLARLTNLLPGWAYWKILWAANQKFLVGAVVVIVDRRGRVLLFRHTFRPSGYEWGLPGGWLKRAESIEQALAREVYEESRLKVQIVAPLMVGAARRVPRIDVVFLGRPLGGRFQPSNEVSAARFFAPHELPRLIEGHAALIRAARRRMAAIRRAKATIQRRGRGRLAPLQKRAGAHLAPISIKIRRNP